MSTINQATREIQAKIVYYGPGLSGKTTTLKSIHAAVRPEARGQLVSLATEGDRTLFFDFLPLTVEQVNGLTLRLQLYTVPGQIFYEATRQLVLNGADAVVFVADSQGAASDANLESLASLERNLKAMGQDVATFPFAIQWNKRDLPNALPVAELRAALNPRGAPEFETVAARGTGVMDALKEVTRQVLTTLKTRPPPRRAPPALATPPSMPAVTPPSAPLPGSATAPPPPEPFSADAEAPQSMPPLPTPVVVTRPPNPAPTSGTAPVAEAPRGALTFTRLFAPSPSRSGAGAGAGSAFGAPGHAPGEGTLAEVENAIRGGRFTTAIRTAAQGVSDVLAGLEVIERSDAARAALLGVDGRDYLRLLRLSRLPEGMAGERDALFALHVLVGVRLKADSI